MCPRRALQPGNLDLCGEVPLNLRGIVATIVGETANVKEIDTLGVCNGRARPGFVPELAPGLAPSGTPKPATNEQPQPGPKASPGSDAPQPGARPGQGSRNVNAAGADPAQAAPGPEPLWPLCLWGPRRLAVHRSPIWQPRALQHPGPRPQQRLSALPVPWCAWLPRAMFFNIA